MRFLLSVAALAFATASFAATAEGRAVHLIYTSEVRGTVGICG